VLALSEGLRQEVKPYNIRTTVISPGAVATELPNTVSDPVVATESNAAVHITQARVWSSISPAISALTI
jgi:NADP-dependent 3-hydroxy acid dehydrogenase YdfG